LRGPVRAEPPQRAEIADLKADLADSEKDCRAVCDEVALLAADLAKYRAAVEAVRATDCHGTESADECNSMIRAAIDRALEEQPYSAAPHTPPPEAAP
jgi:hypothetical protein